MYQNNTLNLHHHDEHSFCQESAQRIVTEEAESLIQQTYGARNPLIADPSINADEQTFDEIFALNFEEDSLDEADYNDLISALYHNSPGSQTSNPEDRNADTFQMLDFPSISLMSPVKIQTEKTPNSTPKKMYTCEVCAKYSTTSRTNLHRHRRNLHNLFADAMPTKSNKSKPKKNVASRKLIPCKMCNYTTRYRYNMTRHHQRIHVDAKGKQCGECGKILKDLYTMRVHQLFIHTPRNTPKVQICPDCGKQFNTMSDLSRHQKLVHENLRPFQCLVCKKCFQVNQSNEFEFEFVENASFLDMFQRSTTPKRKRMRKM